MSDYVHIKAVRYKPTEKNLAEFQNDLWNLEEKFPKFFDCKKDSSTFRIEGTTKGLYVDFLIEYYYGVEPGEGYKARACKPGEAAIFSKLFDMLFTSGCQMDNLRVVEYTYYNGCDPEDCFDLEDEFSKSVEIFGLHFAQDLL